MTKPKPEQKLFFLDQYGCAKNQVDGEVLTAFLSEDGWLRCENSTEASLIIINSCGFIESAKKESIEALLHAREIHPDKKIILAGCLSERYAKELSEEMSEADFFMGNGDLSEIKKIVKKLFPEFDAPSYDEFRFSTPPQEGVSTTKRNDLFNFPGSAYVKITEGCNNCCSFCAIPLIRGNLRSRSIEDIKAEVIDLLEKNVFEINLIGQDLASYGKGFIDIENPNAAFSPLHNLLKALLEIQKPFWLRLLYIHPDNFPLDILPLFENEKRLLPYFDIPFQSGDSDILKRMNRRGNTSDYLLLIEKLRLSGSRSPYADSSIRTTFLTAFPGESDEAHKNSKNFLEAIQPDWSGSFVYSKEEGTKAYTMGKTILAKKAEKRQKELQNIQAHITRERLKRFAHQKISVLVEELIIDAEKTEGLAIGRAWFQAPEVDGSIVIRYDLDDAGAIDAVKPGNLVEVKITSSSDLDLDSVFIAPAQ